MSAKSLFEQIINDGWAGVRAWKENQTEETGHLEFKRQDDIKSGAFGEVDKGQLAKALSGFANVDGGVLVFGVHAKDRGKDKPDYVQNLCSIPDVAKFHAMVDVSIPNLTDPPIPGAFARRIEDATKPGHGVVIVYVPPSPGGPHRAVGATAEVNGWHYMRTSTSTGRMPHTILADRFGRTAQPKLQLVSQLRLIDAQLYGRGQLHFDVRLRNIGRGCAQLPAIRIFAEPTEIGINSHFHLGLYPGWVAQTIDEETKGVFIRATPDIVIYPTRDVLINRDNPFTVGLSRRKLPFRLWGNIYALNMQPVSFDEEKVMTVGGPDGLWELVTPSYEDT